VGDLIGRSASALLNGSRLAVQRSAFAVQSSAERGSRNVSACRRWAYRRSSIVIALLDCFPHGPAERSRRGRSLCRNPLLIGNDQQSKSSTRTSTITIEEAIPHNWQLTLTTAPALTTSSNAVTPHRRPADPLRAETCRRVGDGRIGVLSIVLVLVIVNVFTPPRARPRRRASP
jgi:hypothetical protein